MNPTSIIKNPKIWVGRLTLLIVSILVFFVLGEIIIRLLVPIEPPSPAMFQRLPISPRLIGLIPGFGSKDTIVKINSKGFRDREYHEEKSENTLRIAGLGDSFTFGGGVAGGITGGSSEPRFNLKFLVFAFYYLFSSPS